MGNCCLQKLVAAYPKRYYLWISYHKSIISTLLFILFMRTHKWQHCLQNIGLHLRNLFLDPLLECQTGNLMHFKYMHIQHKNGQDMQLISVKKNNFPFYSPWRYSTIILTWKNHLKRNFCHLFHCINIFFLVVKVTIAWILYFLFWANDSYPL